MLRPVSAAMTVAQYVRFKGEQLLYGAKPGFWVAIKFGQKRGAKMTIQRCELQIKQGTKMRDEAAAQLRRMGVSGPWGR